MLKPTVPQRFDLKTETRFKDYVAAPPPPLRAPKFLISSSSAFLPCVLCDFCVSSIQFGWVFFPNGRNGHHIGNNARHKNPSLCAKTAPISGGSRRRLRIDVPIVFASEKIQFPLRQGERERGKAELRSLRALAEYLYRLGM